MIGTLLLYGLLLHAKNPRKVALEKYFDVDYLRTDQSFKASRSALDESQSYLLSHFWTHLVCVYESVCVCESVWMYMGDGSLWLRNVELWDWFPPHHHQAAGQKHIVYSKFVGLYSIMTVATPLPSPPPPRPHFYMSHKCSVWINVQSCGQVLRRLLVDSVVLCPLTQAATERESLIRHNLWPHHRLSLLPRHPTPLLQLQWMDWSTETQILTLSFIITKHYRRCLMFSDDLLTSGLEKLPCSHEIIQTKQIHRLCHKPSERGTNQYSYENPPLLSNRAKNKALAAHSR